jgi:hypothetical protein
MLQPTTRRDGVEYMLLIYGEEARWAETTDEEREAMYAEYFRLSDDLRARNALLSSNELQPVSTATTVQVRDGETIVTDGPFAETKEALGGYYLIEAESLDEAIEWAARIPSARDGKIEVRPVVDNTARAEAARATSEGAA